ncbi:hypothetical protein ACIA5D_06175 [Actinoplanes sp. NPDC051513]|uniref:hypothetical protein n=1 Tax=Actinoplanes sp. NPDC051513 TaxID=3363908 RepID=UPI0037B401B2
MTAVLAPLARAGYVLRYDMVFVPRQPLTWNLIAPIGTMPRAVPEDALVSLSALIAPGWLVQRVALAGILAAAAIGAGRLVPTRRVLTRLVAALAYAWTPFLAERLLIGQWGLLLCYAALPWIVSAARDLRLGHPRAGARLVLAAACASVTPTGGLIALATTVALVPPAGPARRWPPGHTPTDPAWRRRRREGRVAVAAVAALNAPWLVVAATSSMIRVTTPEAVAMFSARAENWAGALVALAGTGGIWNALAVPASRSGPLVPLVTLVLVAVAVAGFGPLRRRWPEGTATRLARLAGFALFFSAIGVLPGTSGTLRTAVDLLPGAGLFRDGQKFLMPYVLLLALCLALGAEWLADRLTAVGGGLVLAGFLLLPVVALPDLAWGAGGKLRPVEYPAEWATVAAAVAEAPGPVLSLPMSAYRAYPWNPGTVVYDPASRYLPAPVIMDDRLRISVERGFQTTRGESDTAEAVQERLEAHGPAADDRIRWVLVQVDAAGSVPATALAGLVPVHRGPGMELYSNPGYRAMGGAPVWATAGYVLAGLVVAIAGWRRLALGRAMRRKTR